MACDIFEAGCILQDLKNHVRNSCFDWYPVRYSFVLWLNIYTNLAVNVSLILRSDITNANTVKQNYRFIVIQ